MSNGDNLVICNHIFVQAVFPSSQCFVLQIVSFAETNKPLGPASKEQAFVIKYICSSVIQSSHAKKVINYLSE